MNRHLSAIALLFLMGGCDGETPAPDAAPADAGRDAEASICARNPDCDDGVVCNGREVCRPGDPEADGLGCVVEPACLAGQTCDSAMNRCVTDCATTVDADGDGEASRDCGGNDCDDADPGRYPANVEVCDADGRDEDCSILTLGVDADGDGFVSSECCNVDDSSGELVCGDDCNDSAAEVNPDAAEVCDLLGDNDCDPTTRPFDADGDGYDLITCGGNDCLDDEPTAYPSAPELCDGIDNDCSNGGVDDEDADDDGHVVVGSTCTGGDLPVDDCDDDEPASYEGFAEVCDGIDNDCDGEEDEEPDVSAACDAAAASGTAICHAGTCRVATCDVGFADCDGDAATGCEVNLRTDAASCGACGRSCGPGGECDGVCDRIVHIVGGNDHDCVLRESGRVVCWGDNEHGQLGRGTTSTGVTEPAAVVPGLDGITQIAAGGDATCALQATGGVRCWGERFGPTPTAVTGLSGAEEVAVGGTFACARIGGAVSCWGDNGSGQLGDGTRTARPTTPAAVSALSNVTQLSLGGRHACARQSSGAIRCWGEGDLGQIGDGAQTDRLTPVTPSASGVRSVSLGPNHSCSISGTGSVSCWGSNSSGAVGRPTAESVVLTPRLVSGVANVQSLALAFGNTCARLSDGTASCWGMRALGPSPEPVMDERDLVELRDLTELSGTFDRIWAMSEEGVPYDLSFGDPHAAVELGLASDVSAAAGGCGLLNNGEALCWGETSGGEVGAGIDLGDGGDTYTVRPLRVRGPGDFTQVSASWNVPCALRADATVMCWGGGVAGVGDGGTATRRVPVAIPLTGIAEVATGNAFNCARGYDGRVFCWGQGPLGDGTDEDAPTPREVSGLANARSIAVGNDHACAVVADGGVWCWGENDAGELGDGTMGIARFAPVRVALASEALEVVAGSSHSCARSRDGRVYCWGGNSDGRLGDGSTASFRLSPVATTGLADAAWLRSGPYASGTCAGTVSGVIYCWGNNEDGQLGLPPSTASVRVPTAISEIDEVDAYALGLRGAVIVRRGGFEGIGGVTVGHPDAFFGRRATFEPIQWW